MGCLNVREGDGRVVFYDLDGCGNPVESASGKLVLETIAEITWEDTIEDGDEVTERNFVGKSVYSDVGNDELTNVAVSLTHDGLNPELETFLMNARRLLDGLDTAGYGRSDLDSNAAIAMEILVQLDSDACAGGATAAPIISWFFPLVKNWKPTGGNTLNGTDLLKPQFTGRGFKNENIFSVAITDADFAKWDGVHDTDDWYSVYVFDTSGGYSLPDASCDPVNFT